MFLMNPLMKLKQNLIQQWLEGGFQSEDPQVTQAANINALGEAKLIDALLNLDIEQIEGMEDELE